MALNPGELFESDGNFFKKFLAVFKYIGAAILFIPFLVILIDWWIPLIEFISYFLDSDRRSDQIENGGLIDLIFGAYSIVFEILIAPIIPIGLMLFSAGHASHILYDMEKLVSSFIELRSSKSSSLFFKDYACVILRFLKMLFITVILFLSVVVYFRYYYGSFFKSGESSYFAVLKYFLDVALSGATMEATTHFGYAISGEKIDHSNFKIFSFFILIFRNFFEIICISFVLIIIFPLLDRFLKHSRR